MHPNRLPWPASRIEKDLLHELWIMSQKHGKPITVIIADAVHSHLNQEFHEHRAVAEPAVAYQVNPPSANPAA